MKALNKRLKKKIAKKNKLFIKQLIDDITHYYNLFDILDHVTDHFFEEWNWSIINISYTDFRKEYGPFPNDDIDTYSARYIHEDDIIEFNITAKDIPFQRRIYRKNPEIAMAIFLDLFIHEYCHMIEHKLIYNPEADKLNILSIDNTYDDEKFDEFHNARFQFIFNETIKVLQNSLKKFNFDLQSLGIFRVKNDKIREIPLLQLV